MPKISVGEADITRMKKAMVGCQAVPSFNLHTKVAHNGKSPTVHLSICCSKPPQLHVTA